MVLGIDFFLYGVFELGLAFSFPVVAISGVQKFAFDGAGRN